MRPRSGVSSRGGSNRAIRRVRWPLGFIGRGYPGISSLSGQGLSRCDARIRHRRLFVEVRTNDLEVAIGMCRTQSCDVTAPTRAGSQFTVIANVLAMDWTGDPESEALTVNQ